MPRRVLFVIRGKLGDTLVAYATVRRYIDAFPEDSVTLLTRAGYAALLSGESGVRLRGFSSRIDLLRQLLGLRFEPAFDALLVLWGFGVPIEWIGRLVRVRRKVYLDGRYPRIFPEHADVSPSMLQSEPMWRVARIFEPTLAQPVRLAVPSLARLRSSNPEAIGIAPLADEARRIMSPATLAALLRAIVVKHPGAPIRILINRTDRGADALLAMPLPTGAEFRFFPQLDNLVRELSDLSHIYCTDTGVYHLAVSMSVPATVFFGPTQPWKIVLAAQPSVSSARLAVLGGDHCEEKSCDAPLCLDAAVCSFAGESPARALADTPAACPLRAFPPEQLNKICWHENPSHQA